MTMYEGVETFLTSAINGGERSSSLPSCFIQREEPQILIGYETEYPSHAVKRKISGHCRKSNPDFSGVQHSLVAIPA
jgi:hypothetical protein